MNGYEKWKKDQGIVIPFNSDVFLPKKRTFIELKEDIKKQIILWGNVHPQYQEDIVLLLKHL